MPFLLQVLLSSHLVAAANLSCPGLNTPLKVELESELDGETGRRDFPLTRRQFGTRYFEHGVRQALTSRRITWDNARFIAAGKVRVQSTFVYVLAHAPDSVTFTTFGYLLYGDTASTLRREAFAITMRTPNVPLNEPEIVVGAFLVGLAAEPLMSEFLTFKSDAEHIPSPRLQMFLTNEDREAATERQHGKSLKNIEVVWRIEKEKRKAALAAQATAKPGRRRKKAPVTAEAPAEINTPPARSTLGRPSSNFRFSTKSQ